MSDKNTAFKETFGVKVSDFEGYRINFMQTLEGWHLPTERIKRSVFELDINRKEKVRKSFTKGSSKYNRLAKLQLSSARRLTEKLKLLGEVSPILDLGSGTGEPFKGTDYNVIALDISTGMAKECRKAGFKAVVGDGELLPFRAGAFKAVFSNFSLQWMNLERASSEIYRLLKEGGYLLISIPVKGSLSALYESWNRAFFEEFDREDTLFSFPSEKEILSALSQFELIEFERFTLSERFSSSREALSTINKVGARNPNKKPMVNRRLIARFCREFEKRKCEVSYVVFSAIFRKSGS